MREKSSAVSKRPTLETASSDFIAFFMKVATSLRSVSKRSKYGSWTVFGAGRVSWYTCPPMMAMPRACSGLFDRSSDREILMASAMFCRRAMVGFPLMLERRLLGLVPILKATSESVKPFWRQMSLRFCSMFIIAFVFYGTKVAICWYITKYVPKFVNIP